MHKGTNRVKGTGKGIDHVQRDWQCAKGWVMHKGTDRVKRIDHAQISVICLKDGGAVDSIPFQCPVCSVHLHPCVHSCAFLMVAPVLLYTSVHRSPHCTPVFLVSRHVHAQSTTEHFQFAAWGRVFFSLQKEKLQGFMCSNVRVNASVKDKDARKAAPH
eukprot:1160915-Pelagomonas_calceolata.AAC.5